MGQIIKTNGEVIEVSPKNGTDFQLDELKEVVKGWVEVLYLCKPNEDATKKQIMCVNEDGKLKHLDKNSRATILFIESTGIDDFIVGDVLVCDYNEVQ